MVEIFPVSGGKNYILYSKYKLGCGVAKNNEVIRWTITSTCDTD